MAFALTGDPEIDAAVPAYPQVLPEIRWHQLDADKMAAFGGLYGSIFPVQYAGKSLRGLLAEINGRTPIEAFGHCPGSLYYLRNLFRAGLLENATRAAAPAVGKLPAEVDSFLARSLDQTRLHADRNAAARVFRQPLLLAVAHPLLEQAVRQGGGRVEVQVAPPQAGEFAFLPLTLDGPLPDLATLLSGGGKLVPVLLGGDAVAIGPMLMQRGIALQDVLASFGSCAGEPEPLLLSALVHQMQLLSARAAAPAFSQSLLRFSLQQGRLQVERVAAISRAQRLSEDALRDWSEQAALVAVPSKALVGSKPHEVHYQASNLAASLETVSAALPAQPLETLLPDALAARIEVAVQLVFGVRHEQGRVVRNCPSGGNLGSPELLLAVHDARRSVLLRFIPESGDFEQIAAGAGEPGAELRVQLLCLGNHERTTRKYGFFGRKLVWLDGGVALAYWRQALQAYGLAGVESALPALAAPLLERRRHYYEVSWCQRIELAGEVPPAADAELRTRIAARWAVRHYAPDLLPVAEAQRLIDAARPRVVDASLRLLLVQRHGRQVQRWLRTADSSDWRLLDSAVESELPDEGLYLSQHTLDQAGQRVYLLGPAPGEVAGERLQDYHQRVRDAGEWMGALWLSLSADGLGGCPCGAVSERELAAGIREEDAVPRHVLFAFVFGRAAAPLAMGSSTPAASLTTEGAS